MENILIGFNVSLLFSLSQTYQIYFHERLLFLTNVEQITNVNKRVIFFANNNKRLQTFSTSNGIRTFLPGHVPPGHSPALTIPPPFLHGADCRTFFPTTSRFQHYAPIYIKRSTVNVYKIDSG